MAKSQASPLVIPNPDGSVAVQYVPKQSGAHDLNVSYNEIPVAGGHSRRRCVCLPSVFDVVR